MLIESQPGAKVKSREQASTRVVGTGQYIWLGEQASSINDLHAQRVIVKLPVRRWPVEAVDADDNWFGHAGDWYGSCKIKNDVVK